MKKNVLVIGGGGREHAIIESLAKSAEIGKIYCAPGNGGISRTAECVPIKAVDVDAITEFVAAHPDIYMTAVIPDDPLALGLCDKLSARGFRVFGPTAAAAEIEASKAFAKEFMTRHGIPTAKYGVFDDYDAARAYLAQCDLPIVLKADGLALGKGVLICETAEQAEEGLRSIMTERSFGDAGKTVVIEEFLRGREVSVLAFTDGETISVMPTIKDHKRALDGDKGLNTGGMGTYAPADFDDELMRKAYERIFLPTIRGLKEENRTFRGVLYFGLMTDGDNIWVLEYNARFGDPETQAVLPLLKSDLLRIFEAVADGRLKDEKIEWSDEHSVCVVAASGGYPLKYEKNKLIEIGDLLPETQVFHAGTALKDGRYYTNGGRVLSVVCKGATKAEAREKAYSEIKKISFEGMFYRKDI